MNAYEEDRTIISGLQREKQELQEQMKARDQELSGYRISVTELEGKIREVETDRDRRNRDMGSQIARLSQEKEQLKQQEDEIQRLRADLQKQMNAYEEDRTIISGLQREKQEREEQVKARDQELSDYRASITELEGKIREVETDRDRRNRDMGAQIAKLSQEKEQLEKRIKTRAGRVRVPQSEKDAKKRLEAELKRLEQSRQELEKQADKDMRQLNTDLRELQNKYEKSRALVVKLQEEKKDLEVRLRKRESSITVVKDDIAEREKLEAELKLRKQSGRELQVRTDRDIKQLRDELQKQKEQAGEYNRIIKKLRNQEMQAKGSYDNLTKLYNEKNAELETLRNNMRQYEVPVIVINKAKYSILDIINEYILSSSVLSKIGNPFVLWRSGNLYEDFITERILLSKAEGEGIREDRSKVRSISGDYGLSKNEKEYLSKFLKINKFISIHMSGDIVDDRAVRNYYEKHTDQFAATPGVKTFHVLRLRYSETDEIDKALLATSIRQRNINGEPLKEIQRSKPDLLVLERITARDLPNWVNRKIGFIQKGDTSDVIVLEGAFNIFRLISEEPRVLKNYETVKDEIRKDLLLQKKIDSLPVHEWLESIQNEAVQIR
jgi:hypothetical protein